MRVNSNLYISALVILHNIAYNCPIYLSTLAISTNLLDTTIRQFFSSFFFAFTK